LYILFKGREDFCGGENKGYRHAWNILVSNKVESEELPDVSITKTEAAYIVLMITPFTLTFLRKPVVRKEDKAMNNWLQGKTAIVIGERDGVQGPAIANCLKAAGANVVYAVTECFV